MNRILRYVLVLALSLCFCFSFAFADSDGSEERSDSSPVRVEQNAEISVVRVSASDTSGLHSIILSLLGDYNPIVKDYTYTTTSYNGSVTTNHSIEITPDWSWIMTAALFIVVVLCTFKFIGGIFSK